MAFFFASHLQWLLSTFVQIVDFRCVDQDLTLEFEGCRFKLHWVLGLSQEPNLVTRLLVTFRPKKAVGQESGAAKTKIGCGQQIEEVLKPSCSQANLNQYFKHQVMNT